MARSVLGLLLTRVQKGGWSPLSPTAIIYYLRRFIASCFCPGWGMWWQPPTPSSFSLRSCILPLLEQQTTKAVGGAWLHVNGAILGMWWWMQGCRHPTFQECFIGCLNVEWINQCHALPFQHGDFPLLPLSHFCANSASAKDCTDWPRASTASLFSCWEPFLLSHSITCKEVGESHPDARSRVETRKCRLLVREINKLLSSENIICTVSGGQKVNTCDF